MQGSEHVNDWDVEALKRGVFKPTFQSRPSETFQYTGEGLETPETDEHGKCSQLLGTLMFHFRASGHCQ